MASVATGLGDVGSASLPGVGSGSGGGGMEAELGALLSSAPDTGGGDDTPAGESPTLPETQTGDEGYPGGESPTEDQQQLPQDPAQEQSTENAQPNANAEPLPGWKLNQDGTYSVQAAELPRVQSALQFSDAVSQYFPTPQDAQAGYSTASQMRQMQNDWMYGNDNSIQSVMSFLSGESHPDPAGRMTFGRSFSRMLSMAPDYLQRSNPQAYQALVGSFGSRIADTAYQKAANIAAQYGADSQPAKDALQEAQAIEWGLSGGKSYRTELPKHDPQAQARSQFEQQQREFNQRQENALRRDVQAFNNSSLEGAKLGQLDKAILAKLEPIKSRFSEVTLQDIVSGIHREVMQTIEKQADWHTEHRQAFDQLINDFRTTWQNGSPGQGLQPRVQAYIADFMARANRVLGPIAQKRINAATQTQMSAARARNAKNGQFAANAANPANGAPAGTARPNQSANGQNGQPNERRSDKFDREFSALFAPFRG